MIELVPLKPWHIEVLRSNGDINPVTYTETYAQYVCQGDGYTLIVDGKVRGCSGIIPLWGEVGEAWALMAPWCRTKPLLLCKSFKKKIEEMCEPYLRVQITVEEDFEQAVNFALFMGFTFEGRMPYYGPDGKTHLRFARLNDG